MLFHVGFQMMTGALPYYASAVLGAADTGTWVAVLSAVVITAMVLSVPGAAVLARRRSKRAVFGAWLVFRPDDLPDDVLPPSSAAS